MRLHLFPCALMLTVSVLQIAVGQTPTTRDWSDNVIVPHSWTHHRSSTPVKIERVDCEVRINELAATTQLDIHLFNETGTDQTSEILIPVPNGAVIGKMEFSGSTPGAKAELLTKNDARAAFRAIVSKLRDPALLEFAGSSLIRSCVFPVPAGGKQQVRITYEHLLDAHGHRVDYLLPRSESVAYHTPWTIRLAIQANRRINSVYSPTHPITVDTREKTKAVVELAAEGRQTPGSFRVSWLTESGPMTGSLFAYPDRENRDNGYFLLLAGLDQGPDVAKNKGSMLRDLVMVIDHSGSMGGEKIEQAKSAALQTLEGLNEGERFNVIIYNDVVEKFSEESVVKGRESMEKVRRFLGSITATGGTNLHDALAESLRCGAARGSLPLVMFLTDGLPTVGITSEKAIRSLVTDANEFGKRVFTFGVGVDVNTALLDKMAVSSRAFSTFVIPGENVEVAVGRVFRALHGPRLANPELKVIDAKGEVVRGRVTNLLPDKLSDLYTDDQVIIIGRYAGSEPVRFLIEGDEGETRRQFSMEFDIGDSLQGNNSFVARLWASRKIGQLIDEVRDLGGEAEMSAAANRVRMIESGFTETAVSSNPRVAELADEILRLSMQFGILTEYTGFLATEGTDLANVQANAATLNDNLVDRAMTCRSGWGSYNQEVNKAFNRDATRLNLGNMFYTAENRLASIANVQQCNDNAFFRRGNRWIDNRALSGDQLPQPERTIEFASEEYFELIDRMKSEGRQGEMALDGEILVHLDGRTILISDSHRHDRSPGVRNTTADDGVDDR